MFPSTASGAAPLDFAADTEFMFSDKKGEHSARREKRQRKLARSAPFLAKFLEPGEKVLLVATGCSPLSILDQLITGAVIVYLKRAIFVFTDRRIFHVPTTRSFGYRRSVAQVRYSDCASIKVSWRSLKVEYRNGTREKFIYLSSQERPKVRQLLERASLGGQPSPAGERVHLCPRCAGTLIPDNFECPSCRLEFKSVSEGAKLAWLLPGGGYFYTGHPWLGIADAFVEVYLIVLLIGSIAMLTEGVEGSAIAVGVLAAVLILEKVISVYHSNHFLKEYIPKDKTLGAVPGAQPV